MTRATTTPVAPRRWPSQLITVLAALLTTGALAAPAAADSSPEPQRGQRVVVVLKGAPLSTAATRTASVTTRHGLRASQRFARVFAGFAATVSPAKLRALKADTSVAGVYPDRLMRATNAELTPGVRRMQADTVPGSRIGTRTDVDADIAILDTGITAHPDLNLVGGVNCASDSGCSAGSYADNDGHGTHVAGSAAARDNGTGVVGTAPGARLWAVKTLGDDGSGYMSWFIAGLDWVAARGDIEVVNASLGGPGSPGDAVSQAVDRAVAAGVVVVAAAGNENTDARDSAPANAPGAFTVSAYADSDGRPGGLGGSTCGMADDTRATFSNYGSDVDFAAPGVCILSTSRTGGYTTMSGTSMAAPHVAGAAATYLSLHAVPGGSARSRAVRDGLRHSWSASQGSSCGFTGGRSAEVVLVMGGCAGAPDSIGPTPPQVTLTPEATSVTLSWTEASDPSGVSGYSVYRSSGPAQPFTAHASLGAAARGFTDTGLAPETPHLYYVAATDGLGNVGASPVVARDTTPPPAPEPVAVGQPDSVVLSWAAVQDASGIERYEIWRVAWNAWEFTLRGTVTGGTLHHVDPASNGVTYYYVLVAVDNAGNAGFSAEVSATPSADAGPGAPVLTGSTADGAVHLQWSMLTDPARVSNYRVYRAPAAAGEYVQLGTVAASASSFDDRTARSGTAYRYAVAAGAPSGQSYVFSNMVEVTTAADTVAPTAVTVSAAVSDSRVRLSWTPATDAWGIAGYRVWRATGTGAFAALNHTPVTTRTFDSPWLQAGTTYRYYVRAVDRSGNLGAPSAVRSVTTPRTAVLVTSVRTQPGGVRADGRISVGLRLTVASNNAVVVGGAKLALEVRNARGAVITRLSATSLRTGVAEARAYLPRGSCYRVVVVAVSSTGRTWNRATPPNSRCL